ncbi:35072_t:CDS:2, partial [Gigaspora margarita]
MEILKLQELLKDKQISASVNETTDACSRAVVNILFSFNNQTKLVKTEFITTVDRTLIAQLVNNKSQAIQELVTIFKNHINIFIFEVLAMFPVRK